MIVPNTWLSLKFTEGMRKLFLTKGLLRAIVALPNTVFLDAVVDTSIFVVEKTAEKEKLTETKTHVSWYPKTLKISSLDHPSLERKADQRVWFGNPYSLISAGVTAEEERIAEKERNASVPLAEIADVKYGLKAYQEGKGNPKQTREQVNKKAFTSQACSTPDFAPFLEGREVYRYENVWDKDNWIWYGPWLAEPRMPELFKGERLLFRKIVGETLVGTYIQEQAYNNTLLYTIKAEPTGYVLNYILPLLNSRIVGFYFRIAYAISKEDTFPQIMLDDMAQLPIRRISFSTSEPERARLVAELKQLYQAAKFDDILASVEAYLPKDAQGSFISEQEKSDVVHDLLAFLAKQMLEMNRVKQAEIKGFLDWLEGEVGAKVEDLTPKTNVQQYYKLQFDELLAILKKNKRKIAIDPARREPQERLQAEFGASVDKLKPLMERIAATDELIDQIVYKLYGLTEEEIGIAEGKATGKA